MIACKNCGTNNIDGSEYCDECGMRLDIELDPFSRSRAADGTPAYQPPSAVPIDPLPAGTMEGPPPTPPSFTKSTSVPKPAMPARLPIGTEPGETSGDSGPRIFSRIKDDSDRVRVVKFDSSDNRSVDRSEKPARRGGSRTYALPSRTDPLQADRAQVGDSDSFEMAAKLVVERGGRVGREYPITGIETNIGRWDADSGIFPDVDLDEDDPEAKISRRHARILKHNSQYFIEDLGSTNGTFVNRGRRLLPGKRQLLQSGDEIIIGKTFLKFHILR
jgi:FHA domain